MRGFWNQPYQEHGGGHDDGAACWLQPTESRDVWETTISDVGFRESPANNGESNGNMKNGMKTGVM